METRENEEKHEKLTDKVPEGNESQFLGLSDSTRKILERVEQEYAASALGDKKPEESDNGTIEPDNPVLASTIKLPEAEKEMKKNTEYDWKIERLINDSQQEQQPRTSYAPSDFMSLAQSDFVNVEDSISQIDVPRLSPPSQAQSKPPPLPKALVELNSEVSQSTEKLLAIRPQSIMINPPGAESLVSLKTEHMAAEFNRVQKNMDANFGMSNKSQVSVSAGSAVSVRTEIIQKEILDILGTRARKLGVTPPEVKSDETPQRRKSTRSSQVDTSLAAEKVKAELKLLYVEKKQEL